MAPGSPERLVLRSPQARRDLLDIWSFIAADNIAAADALIDRIGETATLIAENPELGRARSELGPDIRSFPIGSYLIFYRSRPAEIEIIRILNGYLDISEDLFD